MWVGEKGMRVAAAALSVAAIDALMGQNPKEHFVRHAAVSIVEGVVLDHITEGSIRNQRRDG
jgi:hypothetical protein